MPTGHTHQGAKCLQCDRKQQETAKVVEVGFEPTRALPPYRISSAAH